jgi:hypothetical protein
MILLTNMKVLVYKEIVREIIRWNKVLVGVKLVTYGLPIR